MLRALAERSIKPDIVLARRSVRSMARCLLRTRPSKASSVSAGCGAIQTSRGCRPAHCCAELPRSLLGPVPIWSRSRRSGDALRMLFPLNASRSSSFPSSASPCPLNAPRSAGFAHGLLTDVVLASCAVPGILPPVPIGDEHFIDGGIVNSAVALGAKTISVLQVGRLERPFQPPHWPWEVGLVAFEVARRHRFASDLASILDGVRLHLLPTGGSAAPAYDDLTGQLRVRRVARGAQQQIDSSYQASLRYLREL